MVSVTVNVEPRAAVDGGLLTADAIKSGARTSIVVDDAKQLLPSSVSVCTRRSSAHASRWYGPTFVLAGTISATVFVDVAPAPSAGTACFPVSSLSPVFLAVSCDR